MYSSVNALSRLNFEKRVVRTSEKLRRDFKLKQYDNGSDLCGNGFMCLSHNQVSFTLDGTGCLPKGGGLEVLTADPPSTTCCCSGTTFGFRRQNSGNSLCFFKGDNLSSVDDSVVVEGIDSSTPTSQMRALVSRPSHAVSLTIVPNDVSTLLGAKEISMSPKKQVFEHQSKKVCDRDTGSSFSRGNSRWDEGSLGGLTRSSVTRSQDLDEKCPMRVNIAHKALIGKGSYAVVFQAMDLDTNHLIAVKEISFSHGTDRKALEALRKELALLKLLDHPNIVKCLGEECDESCLRIFLEYVSGGSISGVLRTFGSFQEKQASIYTRQMLEGLAYLHAMNIMHRDLKGDNLLVDPNGTLKISDFGTAKCLWDPSNTVTVAGTAYFMAPEAILAQDAGLPSDVWSVGCCVIEMLTGKPPFAEFKNQYSLMMHIAETKGELFHEMIPKKCRLSSDAIMFLERCLQRDPAKRPTAQELLSDSWILDPPEAECLTCCNSCSDSALFF